MEAAGENRRFTTSTVTSVILLVAGVPRADFMRFMGLLGHCNSAFGLSKMITDRIHFMFEMLMMTVSSRRFYYTHHRDAAEKDFCRRACASNLCVSVRGVK
jgi:hypothetical protein